MPEIPVNVDFSVYTVNKVEAVDVDKLCVQIHMGK